MFILFGFRHMFWIVKASQGFLRQLRQCLFWAIVWTINRRIIEKYMCWLNPSIIKRFYRMTVLCDYLIYNDKVLIVVDWKTIIYFCRFTMVSLHSMSAFYVWCPDRSLIDLRSACLLLKIKYYFYAALLETILNVLPNMH